MIISHQHKYVFIEIPLTGSYAIHHELCKFYDGQVILHKHASYPEFQKIASDEEKQYFAFATVRNPLDTAVSEFYKLKTNHKRAFSNPEESIETGQIDFADIIRYKQLQTSFEEYFLSSSFWERPYSNMIELSSRHLDYVIRFENLQKDFLEVLQRLDIEQVRPLPIVNKTQSRNASWESYYSPAMIRKAKQKYGPFMKKWGYCFPDDWGDSQIRWYTQLEFKLVNMMKRLYLINIRYSNNYYAKFIRKLRARMIKIF